MAHLEDYVEFLYEELPMKLKGTDMILQLTKNHENLWELAANGNSYFVIGYFYSTCNFFSPARWQSQLVV